jgi:hypothetical protein
MGAWGTGILDDDMALDTLDELRGLPDPRPFMQGAFEAAGRAEYIDYDDGHAVLVSAAIIALVARGRPLAGLVADDDDAETQAWVDSLSSLDFSSLVQPAATATLKVVDGESELRELWTEVDDGAAWQAQGRELAGSLR